MKKTKLLSVILMLAIVFNIMAPVVGAARPDVKSARLSEVVVHPSKNETSKRGRSVLKYS